MTQRNASGRIMQLEALRYVMCILIVYSHFGFLSYTSFKGIYEKIGDSHFAVAFFFVLSGFGLYFSSYKKNQRMDAKGTLRFVQKKIVKIYPLYMFSMLISFPYVIIQHMEYHSFGKAFLISIVKFCINLTCLQSLSGMNSISGGMNAASWFLSTLFLCYLLTPVFISICNRIKSVHSCIVGFVAVIVWIGCISFIAHRVEISVHFRGKQVFDWLEYTSPIVRCWDLLLGMVVCRLFFLTREKFYKADWTLLEVTVLGVSILFYIFSNSLKLNPACNHTVYAALSSSMIYIFATGRGKVSRMLANSKLSEKSGLTIYVFLLHYPICMIMSIIVKRFLGFSNNIISSIGILIGCIIMIILTVTVYKNIIEKRLNEYRIHKE